MKTLILLLPFVIGCTAERTMERERVTEIRTDTVWVQVPARIDSSSSSAINQDSTEIRYVTKDSIVIVIKSDPKDRTRIWKLYAELVDLRSKLSVMIPRDSVLYLDRDSTVTSTSTETVKQKLSIWKVIGYSLSGAGILAFFIIIAVIISKFKLF